MYSARIIEIRNLRKHKYADRLQCTEIDGYNIIVGEDVRVGQRMVFFPIGGQLSEEFCKENRLLREVDAKGRRTGGGYVHPVRRNIAPLRLHGEVSEGLLLPLEVLAKYTDISKLREEENFSCVNGVEICRFYDSGEFVIDQETWEIKKYIERRRDRPYTMYVPWGVERIGTSAFDGNRKISRVIIPGSVEGVGHAAFRSCASLESVTLQQGVREIAGSAFAECPLLRQVFLPESLLRIGPSPFEGSENLESLSIPKNVKANLEYSIFETVTRDGITVDKENPDYTWEDDVLLNSDRTRLLYYPRRRKDTSYFIPCFIRSIGSAAFYKVNHLCEVVIPNGVTEIMNNTFCECENLSVVTIPKSVTEIGDMAFFACRKLLKIRGVKGSEAERFAKKRKTAFEVIME